MQRSLAFVLAVVVGLALAFVAMPLPDDGGAIPTAPARPVLAPPPSIVPQPAAPVDADVDPDDPDEDDVTALDARPLPMPPRPDDRAASDVSPVVQSIQDQRVSNAGKLIAGQISTWTQVDRVLGKFSGEQDVREQLRAHVEDLRALQVAPDPDALIKLQVDAAKLRAEIGVRGMGYDEEVRELMRRLDELATAHRILPP